MVTFEPWVGSHWDVGISGVRILILGEAHYGNPGEERSTFTIEMVQKLGQQKRFRFFTTVAKLVLGMKPGEWLSQTKKRIFWDHVAFYNFIQSFPGTSARISPTDAMWEAAVEPFTTVVKYLAPEMILVCGKRLSSRLPELEKNNIQVCSINHPSSGICYADWQPLILASLESVCPRVQHVTQPET